MSLLRHVLRLRRTAVSACIRMNNGVRRLGLADGEPAHADLPELNEVRDRARHLTDINDHLVTIFLEALRERPSLIVELGVRGGESTFVFQRVARLCDATLVSVDVAECSEIVSGARAFFVHQDDVAFAARFEEWCGERNISPRIDVLFVDTSHLYEHTVQEIAGWFPHLSTRATVFLHDTNLRRLFTRSDGTVGRGWNNDRGVIRALEDFFDTSFDERRPFVDFRDGWLIRHDPLCNGLTVLERVMPAKAVRGSSANQETNLEPGALALQGS